MAEKVVVELTEEQHEWVREHAEYTLWWTKRQRGFFKRKAGSGRASKSTEERCWVSIAEKDKLVELIEGVLVALGG